MVSYLPQTCLPSGLRKAAKGLDSISAHPGTPSSFVGALTPYKI